MTAHGHVPFVRRRRVSARRAISCRSDSGSVTSRSSPKRSAQRRRASGFAKSRRTRSQPSGPLLDLRALLQGVVAALGVQAPRERVQGRVWVRQEHGLRHGPARKALLRPLQGADAAQPEEPPVPAQPAKRRKVPAAPPVDQAVRLHAPDAVPVCIEVADLEHAPLPDRRADLRKALRQRLVPAGAQVDGDPVLLRRRELVPQRRGVRGLRHAVQPPARRQRSPPSPPP